MADHGSIGTYRTSSYGLPTKFAASGAALTGTISGTVKENGVAEPNAWVAVYSRGNGVLRDRVQSSATGTFTFTGLVAGGSYYVVALEDTGTYNALVFDAVEAV